MAAILSGKNKGVARPEVYSSVCLWRLKRYKKNFLGLEIGLSISYFGQQEKCVKNRYIEKLDSIGPDVDEPYVIPIPTSPCLDPLPGIEYPNIYNYLINTPSPVTKEELKGYKNMEGYKY